MTTTIKPPTTGWWVNRDNLLMHHYESGAKASACGKLSTRKLYVWNDAPHCKRCEDALNSKEKL